MRLWHPVPHGTDALSQLCVSLTMLERMKKQRSSGAAHEEMKTMSAFTLTITNGTQSHSVELSADGLNTVYDALEVGADGFGPSSRRSKPGSSSTP